MPATVRARLSRGIGSTILEQDILSNTWAEIYVPMKCFQWRSSMNLSSVGQIPGTQGGAHRQRLPFTLEVEVVPLHGHSCSSPRQWPLDKNQAFQKSIENREGKLWKTYAANRQMCRKTCANAEKAYPRNISSYCNYQTSSYPHPDQNLTDLSSTELIRALLKRLACRKARKIFARIRKHFWKMVGRRPAPGAQQAG